MSWSPSNNQFYRGRESGASLTLADIPHSANITIVLEAAVGKLNAFAAKLGLHLGHVGSTSEAPCFIIRQYGHFPKCSVQRFGGRSWMRACVSTPCRRGMRGLAPLTIGLGPNFVAGETVDFAVETSWGDALGAVIKRGPTLALAPSKR